MSASKLLRAHVAAGEVTIGINHEMLDFRQGRKKDLDLVIARVADESQTKSFSLSEIAENLGIRLTPTELTALGDLPVVQRKPVGSVLIALEAKACMTAHSKSRPRLYDELNSSHQTVHGANDAAIACGLVIVNSSKRFISPTNQIEGFPPRWSEHQQPKATANVVEKVRQLPRRNHPGEEGFDALGAMVISLVNDGTPVTIDATSAAPVRGDGDSYEEMIDRVVSLYDYRFASL